MSYCRFGMYLSLFSQIKSVFKVVKNLKIKLVAFSYKILRLFVISHYRFRVYLRLFNQVEIIFKAVKNLKIKLITCIKLKNL